ncbi:unnamed protein product [marine sediment metagenome]|uniref:Uncharacterized protein n=1 Tax=marine sediment metagenome TaxID=412755 RepID=X1BN66_9ZZZZ
MSVLDHVPGKGDSSNGSEYACEGGGFEDEYPGIYEIIARQRYQGNLRKTGKLLIFVDCGKASLCVTDVAGVQIAFYKAESISEALSGLERALQAGKVDWRPDRRRNG